MSSLIVDGNARLHGSAEVSGSKNATLPIMAAAILASDPVYLENTPELTDVATLALVLAELGISVRRQAAGPLQIQTLDGGPVRAGYEWVRRMRASFCVLGPLLARRGRAIVALPGGCQLGPRPVDLHLKGLAALGARIQIEAGYVMAQADRLRGAEVCLLGQQGPTVTGTANVLSAAVLAEGRTTIRGAATEPEIVDLGRFLNHLGARIEGLGSPVLQIAGVPALGGGVYRVIPDRIEAATLLLAGAITGGTVTVSGIIPEHLRTVCQCLEATGAQVDVAQQSIRVCSSQRPHPIDVTAEPYPGIPSDLQAQFMALLCLARGRSTVRDRVFPSRFMHVAELGRLGAQLHPSTDGVAIEGVARLSGAQVLATDLRASAALVLAGLAADGQTQVNQIDHLDRGYQRLDEKLRSLGARIERQS